MIIDKAKNRFFIRLANQFKCDGCMTKYAAIYFKLKSEASNLWIIFSWITSISKIRGIPYVNRPLFIERIIA